MPTREELIEEDKTFEPFWRRRRYDVLGCFFFAAFIIVACGYAYVRVRYSIAPLRDLAWYGVLIFVVEMLGAISIVFYGVWLIATPDNSDVEGADAAYAPLRRHYHIRVLVPTYSEPLAIVQRTVLAARRAVVPAGCRMTVYLCDDGKRAEKRKFVESLAASPGPEVVYITGRKRAAGKTLNGKSENLNHCLKLIYPEDRGEDEMPNIPLTELMCLFDADQSCSRSFFTALLPYVDSGDNVAVALSPQLMFNVSPNVDIFNHQNVHFWEKMQPGMDALGFISLTGTNMILRCRALQDCGWFPTESVTEDWELGMRMVRRRVLARCCGAVFLQPRGHIHVADERPRARADGRRGRAEEVGLGVPVRAAVQRHRRGARRGAAVLPAALALVQGPLPDVLELAVPASRPPPRPLLRPLLLLHLPLLHLRRCAPALCRSPLRAAAVAPPLAPRRSSAAHQRARRAALAVPIMTLVPIVTLLFGYFPIALNLETVLAITLYYTSLHALTFYCKSIREFRALWLANIGTTILFWPFAKAALLTPFKQLMRRGISFKATAKGAPPCRPPLQRDCALFPPSDTQRQPGLPARRADAARHPRAGAQKASVSLKEIGPSLLIVLLSLLAFIFGLSDFDINVNAPKAIALCWVLYNIVPHVLLLTYARFGSGKILHLACGFLIVAQSVISLLALVLLWVLYPREEDYVKAADLSLRFLYAQWSGAVVLPFPVDWRRSSAPQYRAFALTQERLDENGAPTISATTTRDLTAGFYTGGEAGAVRVTTHVALTTAMLAWSMLDFQEWLAEDAERRAHAIQLVQHGLDFVQNAYIPAPNLNGTVALEDPFTREDAMVYVVRPLSPPRAAAVVRRRRVCALGSTSVR